MFDNKSMRHLTAIVFGLASTLAAVAAAQETISVPLTDPSKPAWVKASLLSGSIRVEAYDGKDVLVAVASEMEEVDERRPERHNGLRRIPNASQGLTIEEKDNKVAISVKSWNRSATLELKVPRRTSLNLKTVNDGEIVVRGVEGELELGNTNGPIEATNVAGSVVAGALNDDIKVTFTAVTPGKAMSFTNMNGDIDVTFPASLKADLRMRSDMGEILTDFDFQPVTSTSRSQEGGDGKGFRLKIENEVHAKVGGGGAEIVFKNFNGDVLIRKGK